MRSSSRSLLLGLVATLLCAQTIPFGYAANNKAVAKSPESKPLDPGWPREITRNGVRLVYYQPQVDEWKNLRELRARFAFVLTPKDGKSAVGIEEVRGDTVTDLENRTVLITNIQIVAIRFPSLSGPEETKLQNLLKSTFPGKPITVSLDRLIASVQANQEKPKTVDVKTDPPQIFVGENGQWQPVNPQGGSNVSSQNQPAKRENSKSGTQNLGTTGQPSANEQTNAKSRKSGGQGGQSNQPGGTAADKKSTPTSRQPGNEPAGTKRTAGGAAGQGSNDVTSGLDREASARQRGSQNVNLQQKSQQGATQGNRTGRQRQSRSANGRSRQRN
jgi:hypothetical protein